MLRLLKVLAACLVIVLPAAVAGCGGQTETDQSAPPATSATPRSASPAPSATRQSDDRTSATWDLLVDQANSIQDETDSLQDEVDVAMEQFGEVAQGDFSPEKFAGLQTAMAEAKSAIKKLKQNGRKTVALWDGAAKYDLTEAEKTLAILRREIARLYLQAYTLLGDMIATTDALFDPSTLMALNEADYQKFLQDVDDLMGRLGKLGAKVEKKEQAADQFAADSGLAE